MYSNKKICLHHRVHDRPLPHDLPCDIAMGSMHFIGITIAEYALGAAFTQHKTTRQPQTNHEHPLRNNRFTRSAGRAHPGVCTCTAEGINLISAGSTIIAGVRCSHQCSENNHHQSRHHIHTVYLLQIFLCIDLDRYM